MKKMALCAFVCGFFACTCDLSVALDYHQQCIVDDSVAKAIKPPGRPTSVSDIIEKIKQTSHLEKETELDLSGNNIGHKGAVQLLEFIAGFENLNFERVNLAYNRIEGDGDDVLMRTFSDLLTKKPNLKAINIVGNNFVSRDWMDSLERLIGSDKVCKFVWLDSGVAKEHGIKQVDWE